MQVLTQIVVHRELWFHSKLAKQLAKHGCLVRPEIAQHIPLGFQLPLLRGTDAFEPLKFLKS